MNNEMKVEDLSDVYRLLNRGEFVAAEQVLRQILFRGTGSVRALVLLGAALSKQARHEEALVPLHEALGRDANSGEGWNWLSICLRNLTRFKEAEQACLNALRHTPDDPGTRFNLGMCYVALGQFDLAVIQLKRALVAQPENPQALQNLGLAYEGLGDSDSAASCFKKSSLLAPNAQEPRLALGSLELRCGRPERTAKITSAILASTPNSVEAHFLGCRASIALNLLREARDHLHAVIRLEPGNSLAYAMLGVQQQYEGDFSGAASSFHRSLELNPDQGMAHYGIVQGKKSTTDDLRKIPTMLQLLERPRVGTEERVYIYYTLAKISDDVGNYSQALKFYDEANALAAQLAFGAGLMDIAEYRGRFEQIRRFFSASMVQTCQFGDVTSRPIFIVGMIRSGTTLMEQIISSHPDVGAGGELHFWTKRGPEAVNFEAKKVEPKASKRLVIDYLKLLEELAPGFPRVTDKMPLNIQMLGLIHMLLPNAKVVLMDRNPVDNCLSIYTTPYAFPPEYALNRKNIAVAYEENQRLADYWQKVLPETTLLRVSYERLTGDPEATIREVLRHCGLPWNQLCLRPQDNSRTVSTPSLYQVRQPIYRTSSGRGRNYEGSIPEFERLLDPTGSSAFPRT
jgi:tetratricopeptide (TPR) repeat protein